MSRSLIWGSLRKTQASHLAAVVVAACAAAGPRPALAVLPCGDKPALVETDDGGQIKRDAAEKVGLILRAPASVNLRALVAAKRRELRQKYAEVDRMVLDQYLLWITCQTISKDPDLVASQKFDEYANLYRLMSEPIAQAAAPE